MFRTSPTTPVLGTMTIGIAASDVAVSADAGDATSNLLKLAETKRNTEYLHRIATTVVEMSRCRWKK